METDGFPRAHWQARLNSIKSSKRTCLKQQKSEVESSRGGYPEFTVGLPRHTQTFPHHTPRICTCKVQLQRAQNLLKSLEHLFSVDSRVGK